MNNFKLEGEFIPLISLLKVTAWAQSGGEAQAFVEEGRVKVNGQVELRKRCKLRKGDKVEFLNNIVLID
jgi:ribosome-associated protein